MPEPGRTSFLGVSRFTSFLSFEEGGGKSTPSLSSYKEIVWI
jgi:hypothetical protein